MIESENKSSVNVSYEHEKKVIMEKQVQTKQ